MVEKPEGTVSGTVYVKFSLNSLPYNYKNKDFMEKSQRKVISSLLGCIGDQMNDYWPGVVVLHHFH